MTFQWHVSTCFLLALMSKTTEFRWHSAHISGFFLKRWCGYTSMVVTYCSFYAKWNSTFIKKRFFFESDFTYILVKKTHFSMGVLFLGKKQHSENIAFIYVETNSPTQTKKTYFYHQSRMGMNIREHKFKRIPFLSYWFAIILIRLMFVWIGWQLVKKCEDQKMKQCVISTEIQMNHSIVTHAVKSYVPCNQPSSSVTITIV